MDITPLLLSRVQFAFTIAFHILFPAFTIGLASYLAVFEAEGAIDRFEGFASEHGARFYGLPLNDGVVTLVRDGVTVPAVLGAGETAVVPFHAGERLDWRVEG